MKFAWGKKMKWPFYIAASLIGIACGLSLFTFYFADGAAYLSHDPKACINCHAMNPQFEGWQHSSHKNWASCHDCHDPKGLISKYKSKVRNGFWHSVAFTLENYPNPIQIHEFNKKIVETNCRTCHEGLVHAVDKKDQSLLAYSENSLSCIRCHRNVGHEH